MLWRASKKRTAPPGFIEPCIPTVSTKVPVGPLWIHEVKQAAADNSYVPHTEAEAQFLRSLKAEGLI
jgi:hypothetical protein